MDESHRAGCMICGADLAYATESTLMKCNICGQSFDGYASCTSGHYVCDHCHALEPLELIWTYCKNSDSTDPVRMALELMRHPAMSMHGPEHHFLVPAVIVTAYYNKQGDQDIKLKKLEEAAKRAGLVPGGVCGTFGACGAGVGAGLFISLITGATSLSKVEWKQANSMTAHALQLIADNGGPRCCKRNTYLALESAMLFLRENGLGDLGDPADVACGHFIRNKQCLYKECRYYKPGKSTGSLDGKDLVIPMATGCLN